MSRDTGIRLYVTGTLGADREVTLDGDQAHYLSRVMRLNVDDTVLAFNGRDGEWLCRLTVSGRQSATLRAEERTRPQAAEPDIWLAFAPVKKTGTDFIIEKATELGVGRLIPVLTANTQSQRVNLERFRANAREAAEQCRRLSVPEIADSCAFDQLLANWPADRALLFLDERGSGAPMTAVAARLSDQAAPDTPRVGFLVGPEGGFLQSELDAAAKLPFSSAVSLGPRILRAETAALAALSAWQSIAGDWRGFSASARTPSRELDAP